MQIEKPQWDVTLHLSEWPSSINQHTTSAGVDGEKGEHLCSVDGNADWCSHSGKQYGGTSKMKNGSSFWPSNPTSGNVSKGTQNTNWKEHKHPYIHCNVIYNRQDMEAAQVSISRWVDKTIMGHLHNGIPLGHKKKKILPFASVWMDLENMVLSEISQSERDKHHVTSLIRGI